MAARAGHAVQPLEAAEAARQVGRRVQRLLHGSALAQAREPLARGDGGFGLRIGLDQVVQRPARAGVVLQLDLAVGDRQHGLGRARMVRRLRQQRAEVGDGAVVVARGVLRIAQPEQRRGAVAALRVLALDEVGEGRLRAGEVALAEDGQRGVEVALLARVGGELAAVDRSPWWARTCAAGRPRPARDVLLAALQLRRGRARAARPGRACAPVRRAAPRSGSAGRAGCGAAARSRRAGRCRCLSPASALRIDPLAQVEDGAARLVVLEQRRVRAASGAQQGRGGQRTRQADTCGASSAVGDLGAAVLRPGRFVAAGGGRLFLAEAHGFDLRVGHAQQAQRAAHGFGSASGPGPGCIRGRRARRCGLRSTTLRCGLACRKRACASISDWNSGLTVVAVVVEVHDARDVERALRRCRWATSASTGATRLCARRRAGGPAAPRLVAPRSSTGTSLSLTPELQPASEAASRQAHENASDHR